MTLVNIGTRDSGDDMAAIIKDLVGESKADAAFLDHFDAVVVIGEEDNP